VSENNFRKGEWSGDQWTPSDDDGDLPAVPRGPGLSPEDRELLELAARALGARFEEVEHEGYGNLHFEDGRVINAWNPLAFGGDAFELAVSLELDVMPFGAWEEGLPSAMVRNGGELYELEQHAGNAVRATSRAITRLAAQIGKQRS
jgi:hypothetical protein